MSINWSIPDTALAAGGWIVAAFALWRSVRDGRLVELRIAELEKRLQSDTSVIVKPTTEEVERFGRPEHNRPVTVLLFAACFAGFVFSCHFSRERQLAADAVNDKVDAIIQLLAAEETLDGFTLTVPESRDKTTLSLITMMVVIGSLCLFLLFRQVSNDEAVRHLGESIKRLETAVRGDGPNSETKKPNSPWSED